MQKRVKISKKSDDYSNITRKKDLIFVFLLGAFAAVSLNHMPISHFTTKFSQTLFQNRISNIARHFSFSSSTAAVSKMPEAVQNNATKDVAKMKTFINGLTVPDKSLHITGALSGKKIIIPDDKSGFPISTVFAGNYKEGPDAKKLKTADNDDKLKEIQDMLKPGNAPDVLSHRLKLGLLIPSTNTSMEQEIQTILKMPQNFDKTQGIGMHTVNVLTPKPKVATAADVAVYRDAFLNGLKDALAQAKHALPQYLIMGMSIEHIVDNLEGVRKPMDDFEKAADGLGVALWHDAATAALKKFGAKNIAILSPFDPTGQDYANTVFSELGFNVVRSFGFGCATAVDIGHVPSAAKLKAIEEILAGDDIDAVIQCGTNFSLLPVIEDAEKAIGKPVMGINQTLLWYALREAGVDVKLEGVGRLFREH